MTTTKPLHECASIVTSKGYAILKEALTEDEIKWVRTELTMTPKVVEKFARGVQSFTIYLESKTRLYVPRQWGIETFGEPEATTISDGIDLPDEIEFIGTPYPYQDTIIKTFINQGGNGLICVPCGRGKTFMALCIAVTIGKRFLIVVDKEFLANQWKGEIERYVKGARVGILQGDIQQVGSEKITEKEYTISEMKEIAKSAKLKVSGTKEILKQRLIDAGIDITPKSYKVEYDITICMLQTICQRDFPDKFFDEFGFTIFDECHHLGAQHFCKTLTKIQTPYMLGLSATPDRDDGLTKVFEYFLGKPVYQETTREPDPTVEVEAFWYTDPDPAYAELPVDWKGEVVTARLLTKVVECKRRTNKILERLKELAADSRRKILILSERRAHLEEIHDGLDGFTRGYYIGGMKQEILDKNAETCQILLATYAMASEAMNIKALNAMIMTSPRKKVEQSTGRILRIRPEHREVHPVIIDVIDQHDTYVRQWYQRMRYYKKCNYTIKNVNKPRIAAEEHAALEKEMKERCIIQVKQTTDEE
jgi:superfamily II DNA or RNA helicase